MQTDAARPMKKTNRAGTCPAREHCLGDYFAMQVATVSGVQTSRPV